MHETESIIVANYLDPGSGYVMTSIIPFLLGLFGTLLAGLGMFFKRSFFFMYKKKIIAILIAAIIIIGGIILIHYFMKPPSVTQSQKVVVLGIDGLDPVILEKGIAEGKLPNFKKLKDQGYYSHLATTVPPQSPVAWASFITGASPAKHEVYDFIGRDENDYTLHLNFSDNPPHVWKSKPFWEYTTQANIETTILFLPDTYPVPQNLNGKLIAGMGVPDILGTQGTFTLFTSKDYSAVKDFRGKLISVPKTKTIKTSLVGPKYRYFNKIETAKIPLEISLKNDSQVTLSYQNKTITLKKGQFSDWTDFTFSIDFLNKVHGIGKFYLKSVKPDIELYVSPINFDPKNPLHPISYPKAFSKDLAQEFGPFYTQGLPIDSWALDQGVFDEEAFLKHSDSIFSEREKMYFEELSKFKQGIFISYFGNVDTMQHMFWRFMDKDDSNYKDSIMNYYQKMDGVVGKTLAKLDNKTTLFILSDHGFSSFDYEVNLNTWFFENGYIKTSDGKLPNTQDMFAGVNWNETKAYAVGYNGIFLNLKGRERDGIVTDAQYEKLVEEIKGKLLEIQNPSTNSPLIKHIYTRKELGISSNDTSSPDLFIGFFKGARASWEGAAGVFGKNVIQKRESKWSGDHLFDPTEVPGILFIKTPGKKVYLENPQIVDVMPTILQMYGVTMQNVEGKDIAQKNTSKDSEKKEQLKENLKSLPY